MNNLVPVSRPGLPAIRETEEFVTVRIHDQLFGLPVANVRHVLGPQRITRVPLAPRVIEGFLNVRGKIVTALNIRRSMGLPPPAKDKESMHVIITDAEGEYSLLVDEVGGILSLGSQLFERNPPTLEPRWARISKGIYRLPEELLLILDVAELIEGIRREAA